MVDVSCGTSGWPASIAMGIVVEAKSRNGREGRFEEANLLRQAVSELRRAQLRLEVNLGSVKPIP